MKIQGLNIFKLMEILPNHEKKKSSILSTHSIRLMITLNPNKDKELSLASSENSDTYRIINEY